MNNSKTKYIFSQKMAGYLMLNGFVLLSIENNIKDKNKKVFLFKESNALLSTMEQFSKFHF